MQSEDQQQHRRRSAARAGPIGKVSSAASQPLLPGRCARPHTCRNGLLNQRVLQGSYAAAKQLGWGGLTDKLSPGAEARGGPSVQYTGQSSARRSLQQDDFPDLPGTPAKSAPKAAPAASRQQPALNTTSRHAWPDTGRQQSSAPARQRPRSSSAQPSSQPESRCQTPDGLADLQRQHPWAQKEIVQVRAAVMAQHLKTQLCARVLAGLQAVALLHVTNA